MIRRFCDSCTSKKPKTARYVSTALDEYGYCKEWYECPEHSETDNPFGLVRVERMRFEEWFPLHGFAILSSGLVWFPAETAPCEKSFTGPCVMTQPINPLSVGDILSFRGGIIR